MEEDKQILARDKKKELLDKLSEFKEKVKKEEIKEPTTIQEEKTPEPTKSEVETKVEDEEVNLPVPESPSSSKERKTKILAIIMVILIVFIIGLGFYLTNRPPKSLSKLTNTVSPTKTSPTITPAKTADTGNWKTYSNKTYNYSFQFSSEFELAGYDQIPGEEEIIGLTKTVNEKETTIIVGVSETDANKALYQKYKESVGQTMNDQKVGLQGNYESISVAGITSYRFTIESETQILSTVLFEKDGFIYSLRLLSDNPQEKENFFQILSTFDFSK